MLRRQFAYALLSLLLLLSQQLALTHGMSHWQGGRAGQSQAAASEQQRMASKSLALEQACDQCLAFAQLGSALGTPNFAFYAPSHGAVALPATGAPPDCRRAVCPFQSRAPPLA